MYQANIVLTAADDFESHAVDLMCASIREAIIMHGHCTIGLSGGSTPVPVYRLLRGRKDIDWSRVLLFLVDERYVPADHPESNQRMVREALLPSLPIAEGQIFFPDTSLPLKECVRSYSLIVSDLKPSLVVLGMGEDGHIASLFPPLSAEATRSSATIATHTESFAVSDRISVTLPVLESADSRLFLLTGEAKYEALRRELQAPCDPVRHPIHALLDDRTKWIVRAS